MSGEDGVNIIGKGTAVAPVVEVRDRNDLPVAGASVVFLLGGNGARFANSATSLTVATDGGGRATAAGLQAVGKGAVRIQVQATYQGETATASVTQTNFANVAEAAKAGKSVTNVQGGGNSASQGASQAAAQGSHHIGLIAVGAGAVAGGVVAKNKLGKFFCDQGPVDDAAERFTNASEQYFLQCTFTSGNPQAVCAQLLNTAQAAAQPFIDANNNYCSCIGDTSVLTRANTDEWLAPKQSGQGSAIGSPMCAGDWP